jgi:hypothetical protein
MFCFCYSKSLTRETAIGVSKLADPNVAARAEALDRMR